MIILIVQMEKLSHRGMSNNLPKATQLEMVKLEFKQSNLPPDRTLSVLLPYHLVKECQRHPDFTERS